MCLGPRNSLSFAAKFAACEPDVAGPPELFQECAILVSLRPRQRPRHRPVLQSEILFCNRKRLTLMAPPSAQKHWKAAGGSSKEPPFEPLNLNRPLSAHAGAGSNRVSHGKENHRIYQAAG